MKKIIILIFSILFSINVSLAASCDQNFYGTLRSGYNRTFNDYYQNNNSFNHGLSKYSVDFIEEYDYNNSSIGPIFNWTPWIINNSYIIGGGIGGTFLESNNYSILYHPPVRSNNNLIIKYNISYYKQNGVNSSWNGPIVHTECKYYQITWCGDGVLDSSDGEKCDPNDISKSGWTKNGCSETCQPIPENSGSGLGTTTSRAGEGNIPVNNTSGGNF